MIMRTLSEKRGKPVWSVVSRPGMFRVIIGLDQGLRRARALFVVLTSFSIGSSLWGLP
jgi:hypothetical protein